MYALHERESEL